MTIKEIADLCEVPEQTVLNWSRKVSKDPIEKFVGNDYKAGEASREFSPEEIHAILGEGGEDKILLVLQSTNPCARKFQKWMFHDVLPSIRKYGEYPASQEAINSGRSPVDVLEFALKGKGSWAKENR
jgi:hypothetical protein